MKPSLALALAAALPALPAQEKPAVVSVDDLPKLRAAFAGLPAADRTVVIALVQGGEPVILTSGSDAGGKDVTRESLLPLFAIAKVLAADAIHGQLKDKVDKGSGEKLGDRELTVRELLDGTALLPDYYVLDGGEGTADAALLRACGALAMGAKLQLRASSLGAPEFVLLEPLAFAGRYKDWTSMLRSTLAPRVPGLDPLGADALSEDARSHVCLPADDLPKLAAARPALLRTLLSVKNVATWLQWRAQQEAPLWTSARMGRTANAVTQPKEQRWMVTATAMNTALSLTQYPSRKAALFCFSSITPGGRSSFSPLLLQRDFEKDLFATDGAAAGAVAVAGPLPGGAVALGGGGAFPPRPAEASANPLAGTRWSSAPPAGGAPTFSLVFGAGAKDPMMLTYGTESQSFGPGSKTGDAIIGGGRGSDGAMRTIWLWPQPDAEKPAKLSAVMVTIRMAGTTTAAGGSMGSSVPQYFELVPEKQ
jgi:hypothetical protein